ncbi:hypothetical protein Fbal_1202 [Ferrimonas balearica DSM 9799]|uniref:Lipoprotein n=1 Tax=Ferrimonas balearica (strain DSM 9799 / CCM 4581 / KCTC 23876 / PAT) TaxID=550540 RepID=E1SWC2_FERBD|nr:hypothetical protein [Ferrimonas balearica]ADN75411.1 hypothetical protein Fbal_1202 [Ferrimonas balearica DSM 9799]
MNLRGCLLAAVLIISGCATPSYRHNLNPEHSDALNSPKVAIDLSESRLNAQFQAQHTSDVGAAAFGALGAVVFGIGDAIANAERREDSLEEISPLVALFEPKKMEQALTQHIDDFLQHNGITPKGEIRILRDEQSARLRNIGLRPGESLLMFKPAFSMTESRQRVHIGLTVTLYAQTADKSEYIKRPPPKLRYQNQFIYQSSAIETATREVTPELIERRRLAIEAQYQKLPADPYHREEALRRKRNALRALDTPMTDDEYAFEQARAWLKDDGATLRDALREGVREVLVMASDDLHRDLNLDALPQWVEVKGDRLWYRMAPIEHRGKVISVDRNDVVEIMTLSGNTNTVL